MAKRSNEFGTLVGWVGQSLGLALFILSTGTICSVSTAQQKLSHQDLIKLSRTSCVRIEASGKSKMSKGSGFFIDPNLVVTCFHVVTEELSNEPDTKKPDYTKWRPFPDIRVITGIRENLPAECISIPTSTEPDPHQCDFAILRLTRRPTGNPPCVRLQEGPPRLNVGDDVYLSGSPLNTGTVLTYKGMLAGFALGPGIMYIQAPINKGNSGGALLNTQGEVIGIINARLGGVGKGLIELRKQIGKAPSGTKLTVRGVDPLEAENAIIDTLDETISMGVGFAINTIYLRDYIQKRNLMKPAAGTK